MTSRMEGQTIPGLYVPKYWKTETILCPERKSNPWSKVWAP